MADCAEYSKLLVAGKGWGKWGLRPPFPAHPFPLQIRRAPTPDPPHSAPPAPMDGPIETYSIELEKHYLGN